MAKNGFQIKRNSNIHFTHKKLCKAQFDREKFTHIQKYPIVQTNPTQSHSGEKMGQKEAFPPHQHELFFAVVQLFSVRPFPRLVLLHSASVSFVWWDGKQKLISKTHKRGVKVKKNFGSEHNPKCRRPIGW